MNTDKVGEVLALIFICFIVAFFVYHLGVLAGMQECGCRQ